MENKIHEKTLDNANTFEVFNDYFENMNLNEDIKKIYEIIDDDELQDQYEINSKLTKLRNDNHRRYYDINISKLNKLPNDFEDIVEDTISLYNFIDSKVLLIENIQEAIMHKKLLDNIYRKLNRIDKMVSSSLKELETENDKKQSKFSITYFKNLDISDETKKILLDKYNELILYNSFIIEDNYENLKRQTIRKDYISEIFKLLNIEEENKINILKKDKLLILNQKIEVEIEKHKEKIQYLQDLMVENSKYTEEFNDFIEFYNKIIAYDDKNYNNAKQTYEILCDDSRFKIMISRFEEMFIEERENNKKEEKFVLEKFGIKNIKKSLDYISANYVNFFDSETKQIVEYVYNKINSDNYELEEIKKTLDFIVRRIWENTITDVYSFNPNEDFYFICSNNQFVDEKYQTILITKKELERVNDYSDYQIGFICNYNDNIMYITENDDIMTVDYDDMSSLKTPIQLEQEFINFKVCNRIALNGYKTKIQAVYYINDGDMEKYMKAIELANIYKLPLIVLKKR